LGFHLHQVEVVSPSLHEVGDLDRHVFSPSLCPFFASASAMTVQLVHHQLPHQRYCRWLQQGFRLILVLFYFISFPGNKVQSFHKYSLLVFSAAISGSRYRFRLCKTWSFACSSTLRFPVEGFTVKASITAILGCGLEKMPDKGERRSEVIL